MEVPSIQKIEFNSAFDNTDDEYQKDVERVYRLSTPASFLYCFKALI
jgi:hypothetical protein